MNKTTCELWSETGWSRMEDQDGLKIYTRLQGNARIFVAVRSDGKPSQELRGYGSVRQAIEAVKNLS